MQNAERRVQNETQESGEGGVRNAESDQSKRILICFAVEEEAAPFRKRLDESDRGHSPSSKGGEEAGGRGDVEILITGMGQRNAERAIREALNVGKERFRCIAEESAEEVGHWGKHPYLVLSCGFAGGLDPQLKAGTVLFETDDPKPGSRMEAAGAIRGRFLFSERVATTAAEKRALREKTGADAVEMESRAIGAICREQGIPVATVRVILDAEEENLPLDFNALMTRDQRLSYSRLLWALARAPVKIGALIRLQKQSRRAAESLADVLARFLQRHRSLS